MTSERKIAALCAAICILLFCAGLARAASKSSLGILTMEPAAPQYGDVITLSWDLPRRVQNGTAGILCFQDPYDGFAGYEYIAEYAVGRAPLVGSVSWQFVNETSSLIRPGQLDYTKVAHCAASLWDEGTRNGKSPVTVVTGINFDVPPQ